mgnify:CR=1 FL=1
MEIDKKKLLNCISATQFATLEVGLYLDTHPHDKDALAKFEMFRAKLKAYIKQYEEEFGPLTLAGDFGSDGFDWIKNPWPWEKEAN